MYRFSGRHAILASHSPVRLNERVLSKNEAALKFLPPPRAAPRVLSHFVTDADDETSFGFVSGGRVAGYNTCARRDRV